MGNEKVDVLAVMASDAGAANKARDDDPYQRHIAGELRDRSDSARDAVAALIEADKEYDAAMAEGDSLRLAENYRDIPYRKWAMMLDASKQRVEAATARRAAALARCQGATNV